MYKSRPKLFREDINPNFFKYAPHTHKLFSFTCCWLSASSSFPTLLVFIFFVCAQPAQFNVSISTQPSYKVMFSRVSTGVAIATPYLMVDSPLFLNLTKFIHLHTHYHVSLTPTKVPSLHNPYINFETNYFTLPTPFSHNR